MVDLILPERLAKILIITFNFCAMNHFIIIQGKGEFAVPVAIVGNDYALSAMLVHGICEALGISPNERKIKIVPFFRKLRNIPYHHLLDILQFFIGFR